MGISDTFRAHMPVCFAYLGTDQDGAGIARHVHSYSHGMGIDPAHTRRMINVAKQNAKLCIVYTQRRQRVPH